MTQASEPDTPRFKDLYFVPRREILNEWEKTDQVITLAVIPGSDFVERIGLIVKLEQRFDVNAKTGLVR